MQRDAHHPQSAQQRSVHLQPFSTIQGYWAIFLVSDWLGVCKKYCCITRTCIVKSEQASAAVTLLQIFSCTLDKALLFTLIRQISHNAEIHPT